MIEIKPNIFFNLIDINMKVIKTPPRGSRPVVLDYAGCKTWSHFAKGTKDFRVDLFDGSWHVVPYKALRGGGSVEDSEKIIKIEGNYSDIVSAKIKMINE